MSKRLLAMLAGVAALAILIGGCGEDAADGTTAAVELTKAQFIKRADAACGKQNETLSQHFGEFSLESPIENGELTKAQSREFSEEFFVPYVESRIGTLQEANLPAAEGKQVAAIVAATEDGLEQAKKNVESGKLANQDPLAKAETMSRKFGFEVCGET